MQQKLNRFENEPNVEVATEEVPVHEYEPSN